MMLNYKGISYNIKKLEGETDFCIERDVGILYQ